MCIRDRYNLVVAGKPKILEITEEGNFENPEIMRFEQWRDCFYINGHRLWIGPVSYTHLDVYKRQRLFHALKKYGGFSDAAAAGVVGNVYQETNHGLSLIHI